MTRFLNWLRAIFSIPGEDGAEWEISEPHDPERITRIWGGGIEIGGGQ